MADGPREGDGVYAAEAPPAEAPRLSSGLNTFYLGAAVAVVIAALTAFLRFGKTDGGDG
jgi:hypothetical protein